jgi:hypothetical protein
MDGVCSMYGKNDKCIQSFSQHGGKRLLVRPRHRTEDNIKMHLKEISVRVWTGFIWLRIGSCDWLL